jgi:ATP-dependent Lon protease
MEEKDNQEISALQEQVKELTSKLQKMQEKLKEAQSQTEPSEKASSEAAEAIDISDLNKVADAIQALADKSQLQGMQESHKDPKDPQQKKEVKLPHLIVPEYPEDVFVIPCFGKPVMPSQIVPMQISLDFEDTILKIAENNNDKVFAIFSLGDKPVQGRDITPDDYPKTGTLARLLHAKSVPGELQIIVEGICRIELKSWNTKSKLPFATIAFPETVFPEADSKEEIEVRSYAMSLVGAIQELLPLNPMYSDEMRQYLLRFNQNDPSLLADCAASISSADVQALQQILDTEDILERLKLATTLIRKELSAAKLQDKIKSAVSEKLSKRQHDFFLREQLFEIQKQLGTRIDDKTAEADEFKKRMKKLSPPDYIKERFESELKKIKVLESGSPEYAVTRNYLDVLTTIPWGKTAKEEINLSKAREILDHDHEGLKDVKERIIEFLAVGALKGGTRGAIMLFVGPPGVGKTSIGKSIAKALNRPFFRLSLGGVDDESVIKGHRKTYIGAMPGKMVQALRESKVMNPVIMLDEIDKLSHSYQGDPASALLETLDPEQNNGFLDHYLDEKLDLSNCLFICTANTVDTIPPALLDRMDPIRLSGYITEEKLLITKKHLLPRGLKEAHMRKTQLKITDKVIVKMIEEYARESGMRSTERAIDRLIRKAAVKIVGGEKSVSITEDNLESYLGTAPFKKEKSILGVGVITGLAWTSVGGATLSIESSCLGHEAKSLELTGSLGKVMQESAKIAYSYIQANLGRLNASHKDFFDKATIHIHVPEGATPKDGPSAGVTLASSLLSLALGQAPKSGFAMTGELSLTGQVLAIGGIREKTIAARRMGIFNIICPKANEGDVKELPPEVKEGVNFYFAEVFDDVAALIFTDITPTLKTN